MKHYETVYALLRAAVWSQERYPLACATDTDWQAVYQELCDHAVAALAVDVLPSARGLDRRMKMTWIQKATRKMTLWHKLMKEQDALRELFEQADIPFVVMKGSAAAMYYPQPEYRTMGDVDLIVQPQDFDRAEQLMRENGYTAEEDLHERHIEFRKSGILFELHRHFSEANDTYAAKALDDAIFAGIKNARTVQTDQYRFPALESLENGLVLLEHIDHHMESGLGLRQIVDWMCYADALLDDEFWYNTFEPWAEKLGLKIMAVTVTRMCQMYLGLRQEGITWCANADEELCRELMELTMSRGNFGRKAGNAPSAMPLLHTVSKLSNIPKMLQAHGCINWKTLRKYPFLKPFAWLYQICHYMKKIVTGEYPLRRLLGEMRASGKQDDLMTRLGVAQRAKNKFE